MALPKDIAAALKASPDPLLLLSGRLTIVEANDAFLKMAARSRNDLIGQPVGQVFRSETLAAGNSAQEASPGTAQLQYEVAGTRSPSRLIALQDLLDHAPGFMAVTRGPDHVMEAVNQACYQVVCHRSVLGKPLRDIIPEQGEREMIRLLDGVYETGEPCVGHAHRVSLQRVPGATPIDAYVDFVCQPIFSAERTVTGVLLLGYEVTAQVQAQVTLRASEQRLHLALEAAGDGVWDWDIESNNFMFSRRGRAMLGYDEHEIGSRLEDWLAITHPEDQQRVRAETMACVRGKTRFLACEYRVRGKNGSWKWILARGAVVSRDNDGRALRMVGTTVDVSFEQETLRRANFDALTGLPNRSLFRDRLEYEVANSRRSGKMLALMFVDLDRFKEVNDLLGHDSGDALLRETAARIRSCVRSADTVARLGGDEFTVILTDLDDRAHVETIAQKILQALARPFLLNHEIIHVSGSLGITLHPSDGMEPERLLRNADQAMYVAKSAGRNQFSFFTRAMQEQASYRLKLIGELRNALPARQLRVYFQPIVDLRDGRIVKGEALVRWMHPEKGLVCPNEFISLAEETGLINEIGNWVFMQAAAWCRRWSERFGAAFQISVNKSPAQFLPHKKEMDWGAYLNQLGMAWNSVAVEITEGLLLNASSSTAEKIFELRDAGVQVAIDDFGTGYSSMAYLKKFDVDYLKVDQSFIRDTAKDSISRTIAETIIVMAHKLGLKVIAEGVETAEQRDWLQRAGCDYAQGFLYARPLPPDEFEKLLGGRAVSA
ncbi:EAL domain-containing protein [Noviherbaspirillum autotrophicum]|uniref:EAL domain-containing protein n=1 Tax=Noviherbaspirillum autotrophicum TaxID=709839 RepID=UPI0006946C19|nr:EAL domain-containing protein [Noviherbaspirillum autotrophicum]